VISTSKVKVLGLLALPVMALAVAVMVFSWGHSTTSQADAIAGVDFSIEVPEAFTAGCDTTGGDITCDVPANQAFTVNAYLDDISGLPNAAYEGMAVTIAYSGVITSNGQLAMDWPECVFGAPATGGDFENYGCAIGISAPASTYTDLMVHGSFQCGDAGTSGTVFSRNTTSDTSLLDDKGGSAVTDDGSDVITVNCEPPPPTDTPLPTPTPAPVPPVQKLPALQNEFLERQGEKIPPQTCLLGQDAGELAETVAFWAPEADPKDPEALQELGAFEFEVHYDADKICVQIVPVELSPDQICIVEDSTNSQLEGVARAGCVTAGKANPMTTPEEGGVPFVLANIIVSPQPDVYSQAKPNQDNGVVVQLNNVGCELADLQGHPIPIFSCEDADITFRYLEGDVTADCAVDVLDTQSIAFRWGAEKGSLIYADFMNLEPSGAQADDDIDIKDLQFVFGRYGSTCEEPHPPQDPVNPKG
jgi:hypothetical protein